MLLPCFYWSLPVQLQGWLKGVNSTSLSSLDMGRDGYNLSSVSRDVLAFALHYNSGDYRQINLSRNAFASAPGVLRSLYNGNIGAISMNIGNLGEPLFYNYRYDQLNRLVEMDAYHQFDNAANQWNLGVAPLALEAYKERITYDANGNIGTYWRNGRAGKEAMDDLHYQYIAGTNQLDYVTDGVDKDAYKKDDGDKTEDIDGQNAGNYHYDLIGNLTRDIAAGLGDNATGRDGIFWNVYGKIERVEKNDGTVITYGYDAAGNRISKVVTEFDALTQTNKVKETWYVRDASGNVMGVYEKREDLNGGNLTQTEAHLYGSSRLGVWNLSVQVQNAPDATVYLEGVSTRAKAYSFERGRKAFELSNHLGNVLVTISDKKIAVDDGEYQVVCPTCAPPPPGSFFVCECYNEKVSNNPDGRVDYCIADVLTASDYYPFGMVMPGRQYSAGNGYRYGFNGKEQDPEVKGTGAQYDYGFRIYDPALGRFLSVDPLFKSYPWYTPYQFAGNKPIIAVDLDGLEEQETNAIDVFVITTDPIASKTARTMASTNPRGLVLLQQQSWNQIVVDINDIVQRQFNPNYNIDPEFTTRVKDAMYGYFGTNALSKYTSYSLYAGGNVTGIQQSAMDKAFEIANDYARSRFFGEAVYNNDLNKINQAKDPNTKAALIQERHDRTTKNYQFTWFVNLQMMELFAGFMTLGESNVGPLNRTNGFALENANAAKYKKVDDLIADAGTLTRLKGGVKQGTIKGDAYEVLQGMAKQYGAELQADSKGGVFFRSGELRMGIHNSTRTGVPTIDVNNAGKTYKIRVENE